MTVTNRTQCLLNIQFLIKTEKDEQFIYLFFNLMNIYQLKLLLVIMTFFIKKTFSCIQPLTRRGFNRFISSEPQTNE